MSDDNKYTAIQTRMLWALICGLLLSGVSSVVLAVLLAVFQFGHVRNPDLHHNGFTRAAAHRAAIEERVRKLEESQ